MKSKDFKKVSKVKVDVKKRITVALVIMLVIFSVVYIIGKMQIVSLTEKVEAGRTWNLEDYQESLKEEMLAEIAENERLEEEMREERMKTRINDKIKETKKLDYLEIRDIEIEVEEGRTILTANVVNTGETESQEFEAEIKFIDAEGFSKFETPIRIRDLRPQETDLVRIDIPEGMGEIYDFTIEKR